MKKVIIIALALIASNGSVATGVGNTDLSRHTKIVSTKFDAFNRHDAATIQASYAPNAVLHSPDYPDLHGNSAIADTYRSLFDAIPDATDTIQALGYSDNKVYAQFLLSGHVKGAPDKPVSVRIMSVYTIRDNLIVEDATYYDRKAP
jgi:ketosteroid isomerase-like protein